MRKSMRTLLAAALIYVLGLTTGVLGTWTWGTLGTNYLFPTQADRLRVERNARRYLQAQLQQLEDQADGRNTQ